MLRTVKRLAWKFDCITWLLYHGCTIKNSWAYANNLWFENCDPKGTFYEPGEDQISPEEAVRCDMEYWE